MKEILTIFFSIFVATAIGILAFYFLNTEKVDNGSCHPNGKGSQEHIDEEDALRICEAINDKALCLDKSISRHDQPPEGDEKVKICNWKTP